MKFWQSLAFVEMDQTIELAQFCEELGFYGVSCGDHLATTQQQVDAYEYRDNGEIFWNAETHWLRLQPNCNFSPPSMFCLCASLP